MKHQNEQTDEQLVRSYLDGDNAAFDALLQRYESKVYAYIVYSVRDEELAQDLFQDCFMRVVSKLQSGQYSENGKFSCWLMRIAHNLVIDHHRQDFSASFISNDEVTQDLFSSHAIEVGTTRESEIIDQQTLREVKQLIAMLPEHQREVVLMRYYDELSFKEIAMRTGVSINTALGRMRYALINLRKLALRYDVGLAG